MFQRRLVKIISGMLVYPCCDIVHHLLVLCMPSHHGVASASVGLTGLEQQVMPGLLVPLALLVLHFRLAEISADNKTSGAIPFSTILQSMMA
eukprot:763231-Hanusia_phi.AAC.3